MVARGRPTALLDAGRVSTLLEFPVTVRLAHGHRRYICRGPTKLNDCKALKKELSVKRIGELEKLPRTTSGDAV